MAEGPEKERLFFKDIPAVPSDEIFDEVGVADDESGKNGGFGDRFKIPEGDDILEAERYAAMESIG